VPIELERAWIGVAWALEIPLLAWVYGRLRIGELRTLAWVLAGMVVIRMFLNPNIFEYPIGTYPVWNWLLYGYGIPVAAFAVGAWLFRRTKDDRLVVALEGGAIAFVFVLLTLNIRQYFHPGDIGNSKFLLLEWGTFSAVWFVYGWGLLYARRYWPKLSLQWGGSIIAVLAVVQTIFAQGLVENPFWSHHAVGAAPVFNWLLFLYGLPALLVLPIGREFIRHSERSAARVCGMVALLLVFALITLEVRQWFHGSFLDVGETLNAELYAYSLAWVLFGTVLLVLGIRTRGTTLRYASLAVMLLAVGKVFLFDTAHLEDLYRVFSFLGLGLSLILLALLYQRFVFRKSD
ncbi:MAG: DUF2339 domain-containing protein, partial [Planctomycetota bacterium]